jgi:hypothetical protein
MGFFGGGQTVYVSSVAYNMAGDVIDRPNFLKTTVSSNIISNSKFSMSDTINSAYINGPGINLRGFHRWTKAGHFDLVGVPFSRVTDESDFVPDSIASQIPRPSGHTVGLANLYFGLANQQWWVYKYLLNYSQNIDIYSYTSRYDVDIGQITIFNPDGSVFATFTPDDFDPSQYYYHTLYNERIDDTNHTWVGTYGWTYRIGSGNAFLDNLVSITNNLSDEFVAAIPIRINNEFLSDTYMSDVYTQTKKAYKKLTRGQKLSKLIAKISENANLSDIDHAFLVNGVAINTKEPASLKYLAKFFQKMSGVVFTSWAAYQTYQQEQDDYEQAYIDWAQWPDTHPGQPRPAPPVKPSTVLASNSITITTNGAANTHLHMTVQWRALNHTVGTGLGKPDAKPQDVWWSPITVDQYNNDVITLYWQTSATTWESFEVAGLEHVNEIYDGEAVVIGIREAMDDTDESGFIIPIHYETLRSMSLIDSTQMAMSCCYLVFNCYKVVKQKWYQTGAFKVFIVLVIIGITIATAGTGTAPSIGILGSAASVGAALGFTGVTALIVGAIANAIAAMIVMQLIQKASTAIFGAKIGAIIAAVASVVAIAVGGSLMSGQSMAASWGSLMSAGNIISMTSAVGKGITGYVQASAMDWQQKTQDVMEQFQKDTAKYTQMYIDQFGAGGKFAFDATQLTDMGDSTFVPAVELLDTFLQRTLMTGSDIAEMSMDMLSNFSELTLNQNTIFSS